MPRTPEQNRAVKEKRKKRLLDVALKTFAVKGYADVTTDSISRGARVSHGLFYRYFSSKDDAYHATVRHFVLGPTTPFLSSADMKQYHGVDGLKKFFEIAENIQTGDPQNLYIAKIVLEMERGGAKGPIVKETLERFDLQGTFQRLVAEGQSDGEVIAGDPKEITFAFFDLFTGLVAGLLSPDAHLRKTISKDTLLAMTLKKPL